MFEQSDGVGAIVTGRHFVAQQAQQVFEHVGLKYFIVHEEDAFATGGQHFLLGGPRRCLFGQGRQVNVESRARSRGGVHQDQAAQAGDDAVDHGKAHTGAFSFGFGGKERVEDPGQVFGTDAFTGIDHR